jgi:type IV pilus assembly protein PilO
MTPQKPASTREQLSSPLTLHYIGVGVLAIIVLFLAVRLVLDWSATTSASTDALVNRQIELKTLEFQTAPLRGIDQRVVDSRKQIQSFYSERIPANYSSIAVQIGDLAVKSGVHISGLQYTQGATTGDLTEISMDARIGGEYPQIMHFVNGLERSHTFFVIRAMAFTGQQGGLVNLRLRVSTWLRPSDVPSGLPPTPTGPQANALPASQEGL